MMLAFSRGHSSQISLLWPSSLRDWRTDNGKWDGVGQDRLGVDTLKSVSADSINQRNKGRLGDLLLFKPVRDSGCVQICYDERFEYLSRSADVFSMSTRRTRRLCVKNGRLNGRRSFRHTADHCCKERGLF